MLYINVHVPATMMEEWVLADGASKHRVAIDRLIQLRIFSEISDRYGSFLVFLAAVIIRLISLSSILQYIHCGGFIYVEVLLSEVHLKSVFVNLSMNMNLLSFILYLTIVFGLIMVHIWQDDSSDSFSYSF